MIHLGLGFSIGRGGNSEEGSHEARIGETQAATAGDCHVQALQEEMQQGDAGDRYSLTVREW